MGAGEAMPASFNTRVRATRLVQGGPRRLNLGDLIKTLGPRTPKFWAACV
jgi:hypothetical protein